jgi:4-alpha-glucanotransferase
MGDLGAEAYRFVDWLAEAGASVWQILPLSPAGKYDCPYVSTASLAGNPLLVDLVELHRHGLLDDADLEAPAFPEDRVDFAKAKAFKRERLAKAARRLMGLRDHALAPALSAFAAESTWLDDAVTFLALHAHFDGAPWWTWPLPIRDREPAALARIKSELADEIAIERTIQFFFDRQWGALRSYATARGIRVLGDLPIYVDGDSADVWSHRSEFQLDEAGFPTVVAGVPPDYFSALGQRWGNPIYRWNAMAQNGFAWWRGRMRRLLGLVDVVRIDHFRGLAAYWEIPASAADARVGRWVPGPGHALFDALREELGDLPLVAEDLGLIDEAVLHLRDEIGLPGMHVLQFAFGGSDDNPHLPKNHVRHALAYPGTHDNDTALGWWQTAREEERKHARVVLAPWFDEDDIAWTFVRAALASVSNLAVIPLQDVLSLGTEARMNNPGTAEGNWSWRMRGPLAASLGARLRELVGASGRSPR